MATVCALKSGVSTACALNSGVSVLLLPAVCALNFGISHSQRRIASHSQRRIASFCGRSSRKPLPNIKLFSPLGIASKPFLHGEQSSSFHAIPILPNRRLLPSPPRASTNEPQEASTNEPQGLTGKPTFEWRISACNTYLLSFLAQTYCFVETLRSMHPFLKGIENCPFLMSILRIPSWFTSWFVLGFVILHCLVVHGVMEKKEVPHFFKSHVFMSLVLFIFLMIADIVGIVLGSSMNAGYMSQSLNCWKSQLYWGKIGMHSWIFISIASVVVDLECMRCALCGMHPNVPFLSDMVEQEIYEADYR